MALFSRSKTEDPKLKDSERAGQKENEAPKADNAKKAPAKTAKTTDRNLSSVIIKPRITEKAVMKGEKNVYTFVIRKDATKHDVRDAVKALFKVTPIKVNIVNKSPRSYVSRSRGRRVSEAGLKKAYVYLKAGDTIDLA